MERGWAINLGGGFHHCSKDNGGGFCFYADISLCIRYLFEHRTDIVKRVMVIDLDAHQGNGHETDFIGDDRVFIMDVYNRFVFVYNPLCFLGQTSQKLPDELQFGFS